MDVDDEQETHVTDWPETLHIDSVKYHSQGESGINHYDMVNQPGKTRDTWLVMWLVSQEESGISHYIVVSQEKPGISH